MVGHFCPIPNVWVIVTVGLIIFSATSGYFTWSRYPHHVDYKRYWSRKCRRLLPSLFVVYLFLFIVFLMQKRSNLWTWQTIVNIFGMNGFLNWLGIHNNSPYGAGMWFLTLLLLFYASYPVLKKTYSNKISSIITTIIALILFFIFHKTIDCGHALWMTSSGFFMGMMMAKNNIRISKTQSILMTSAACVGILFLHYYLNYDGVNYIFILAIACGILLYLQEINLNSHLKYIASLLSGILLELYLIHPYLYLSISQNMLVNQVISILFVLIVGSMLGFIVKKLNQQVFQTLVIPRRKPYLFHR